MTVFVENIVPKPFGRTDDLFNAMERWDKSLTSTLSLEPT